MIDDLELQLRERRAALPDPDEGATAAARAAMHAAISAPRRAERGSRAWMRSRRSRTLLIAAALVLAGAGAGLAARGWTIADLPPFGDGDGEAFVLPATDVLPGGYERTRPPRYADLPARPSLVFPEGVGYTEALARYAAARTKARALPAGAALSDPLPAGKAVMVRDGRVSIDPAAPIGYSATTGLVNVLGVPFGGDAVAIARCQLLLGSPDPASPACDAPGIRAYVREGVAGRWLPSPDEEDVADRLVPSSTQLSVIDHPTTPRVRISPEMAEGWSRTPLDRGKARLALDAEGVRLVVVPAGPESICFFEMQAVGGGGGTCGPRAILTGYGAMLTGGRSMNGPVRINGLVGDGIERVVASDGQVRRVAHNVFTIARGDAVRSLRFSGPVGEYTITLPGRSVPRFRPDRARERELIGIELSTGGHASIRIAPNRGGGTCRWIYIDGAVRSSRCTIPGDPPLDYDVVTGGFEIGERGYPYVYDGEFATEVGSVEMAFSDGSVQKLRLVEGSVLHEVPRARIAAGVRPVSVTTFDHQGVALARDELRSFGINLRQQGTAP